MAYSGSLGSTLFFLFSITASYAKTCPEKACSPYSGEPTVRFPFQIIQSPHANLRCGYPGFELSCVNSTSLILTLPSGDFIVREIFYETQSLYIEDPNNCLSKRLLEKKFDVSTTHFEVENFINFNFLNCSPKFTPTQKEFIISCLSGDNYTVIAVPTEFVGSPPSSSSCRVISNVMVPVRSILDFYFNDFIELRWDQPSCGDCVQRDGVCGFKNPTGDQIACFDLPSFWKRTLVGAIIGSTGIVIAIGATIHVIIQSFGANRGGDFNDIVEQNREVSLIEAPQQHSNNINSEGGLNRVAIESYPMTIWDKSLPPPKSQDNTCSICLAEYEPRETIRTITECNHYFHAYCIDQWLLRNASCPLCRNLPKGTHHLP